jgi:hypothetical protein
MPRVRIRGKLSEIMHQSGPKGIQMDVPHELPKVDIFITQDRLVTVLKKMPLATVSSVEG